MTTPMTRERFAEILREYRYSERQIALLWDTRPPGIELDEKLVRETAAHLHLVKDDLTQA